MEHPPLDELKFQPLPELAAALRACKPRVLARWREQVRRILPSADELTRKQLEDDLPRLLDQAAAALEASEPAPTHRLIAVAPVHGAIRFHQHFDLNELLIEYAILRRVLFEELIHQCGRPLISAELIALHEAVDVALRQAAIAFADHQAGELRVQANAMTKYLSFLSHDLRGGLNGALLMIEVLRRELEGDPKYASSVEDLDGIRRSMLETVATMDRFLHAEKLRRGKMPVKIETVRLDTLLHELARGLSYEARSSSTTLEVVVSEAIQVRSDRELLSMIVQNLMSNAMKYGRGTVVQLKGQCGGDLAPEVACRISVIDRGPGITQDQLNTLFAPFVRGETYGQKGIGLGLFIARQASELIGGKLWGESKPGQGTQFHLDLPECPPSESPPSVT